MLKPKRLVLCLHYETSTLHQGVVTPIHATLRAVTRDIACGRIKKLPVDV